MIREINCRNCGMSFKAPRSDAKWCPECKKLRMREGLSTVCPICGGTKYVTSARCISCENRIKWGKRGEQNQNWRGGKTRAHGYVLIRVGAGRDAKYIQEHRIVWAQANGSIPEGHVIHHLNGIKDDNRLENLACLLLGAHSGAAIHRAYKSRIRELESQVRALQPTTPA